MIRILHYGLSSNLGGIETYLWNLWRTIDRDAYTFDFVYSDTGRPPALAEELKATGSRLFGVTPRRVSPRRNRSELTQLISPDRFDILHFNANTASYVEPVRAALQSGVRVIMHSHNAGASRSPVTRFLHRANRRILPWDRIASIAVSEQAGRWMFGRTPFQVIPNGIDVDAFRFDREVRERTRAALGLDPAAFVIGQVGAFLPAKNQEFSLDVLHEVLRTRPNSVLLFVGTGPLEERARARALRLGVESSVRFLGRRDDVSALMSAMDAFLLPSLYEGLPFVALEAQAAGLPCLLSSAAPTATAVLPSTQRLLFERAPAAWANALLRGAASPMRESAADVVAAAGYSVAANTASVEALYARVSQE